MHVTKMPFCFLVQVRRKFGNRKSDRFIFTNLFGDHFAGLTWQLLWERFLMEPSSQTNRRALKLRSPSNTSPILTVNCHTILQRHLDLRGHCQRLATENGDLTCAARRCCRLCSIIIILHHENCLNQGDTLAPKTLFFLRRFQFLHSTIYIGICANNHPQWQLTMIEYRITECTSRFKFVV